MQTHSAGCADGPPLISHSDLSQGPKVTAAVQSGLLHVLSSFATKKQRYGPMVVLFQALLCDLAESIWFTDMCPVIKQCNCLWHSICRSFPCIVATVFFTLSDMCILCFPCSIDYQFPFAVADFGPVDTYFWKESLRCSIVSLCCCCCCSIFNI